MFAHLEKCYRIWKNVRASVKMFAHLENVCQHEKVRASQKMSAKTAKVLRLPENVRTSGEMLAQP